MLFSCERNQRTRCTVPQMQRQMCNMILEGAFPELGRGEEIRLSKSYLAILNLLDDAADGYGPAVRCLARPSLAALALGAFYPRGEGTR